MMLIIVIFEGIHKLTDFLMRLTVLHLSVADLPSDTLTSGEPIRSM